MLEAVRAGEDESQAGGGGLEGVEPAEIAGDAARIAFWVNLYNAILLGEMRSRPRGGSLLRHRRLFRRAGPQVGAQRYSLDVIEHGLLRVNRRPPYSPRRLLRRSDPRLAGAPSRLDPRIHFALNCGAASCPPIRSYGAQDLDRQLDLAACSYLIEATIDADAATVTLPGLLRLYRRDFGSRQDQLDLLARCRSGEQSAWLLEHAARARVRYSRFDWTIVAATAS